MPSYMKMETGATPVLRGTLYALAEKKLIERKVVAQAIKDLGVGPEMVQPQIV